jgi:Ser/Thr protein kinase RdoA (MazF antagonist)
MLHDAPRFSPSDAERIARDRFGLDGRASELTSERDQNFLIDAGGRRVVIKIANAAEERAMLDAQQRALAHLATTIETTPRVFATVDGSSLTAVTAADGKRHFVWAVTWLDGRPLAHAVRRSPDLWRDFGEQIGQLDAALAGL